LLKTPKEREHLKGKGSEKEKNLTISPKSEKNTLAILL